MSLPPSRPSSADHGQRELPPPSEAEQEHSARLVALIRQEIDAAGGAIGFDRFMALALYAPGLGYYSAGARKFGAGGDFVTAPELSPLFSRCLARQAAEVLARLGAGEVLEFGAGSGVMAAELLLELERIHALPAQYLIMEVSGELRARQRETLAARVPHLLARVRWLDALPQGFVGVVLANEVLDAMPVRRVRVTPEGGRELGVAWRDAGFAWCELGALEAPCAGRLGDLPDGYETEVGLAAEQWTQGMGQWLARGVALLIDYGFPRHEFYHPQRTGGTLMCHYRHRAHGDPLCLVGLQDITAHVDFTAIAEAALAAGLEVQGFASQANFLLGNGLLEMLQQEGALREHLQQAAQIKRLLMPGEMGELFKVLALGRGVGGPWSGFALRDERHRL